MIVKRYKPRGTFAEVMVARDPEFILAGPAGTGKSRLSLEKAHAILLKYPGARGLMFRKTRSSMTQSCMITYQQHVLHKKDNVHFKTTDQYYDYPNGSMFVVAGMDDPEKVKSTEYDFAYCNEVTDISLHDWEIVSGRLRNGVVPYQIMWGDCNPGPPDHWIKRRCEVPTEDTGKPAAVMYKSRHQDNPILFDFKCDKCGKYEHKHDDELARHEFITTQPAEWTPRGVAYMQTLRRHTGVNYKRLYLGEWAAAEGVVYDEFDQDIHLVDKPKVIPGNWRHYWTVDFGFRDPFVWQHWLEDEFGNLYLYEEIYYTNRIVEDHCATINQLWRDEKGKPLYYPTAIICDHDAEGRAVIERNLGMFTTGAYKAIKEGIDAVKVRLGTSVENHKAGHARRPGLYICRDATVEIDPLLTAKGHPTSTQGEITSYVWDQRVTKNFRDMPIDANNHGMDAKRYMVAFADSLADDPQETEEMIEFGDRVSISPW